MNDLTLKASFGSLLRYAGCIAAASGIADYEEFFGIGDFGTDVSDCIKYRSIEDIEKAGLPHDSPAYISCMAGIISSYSEAMRDEAIKESLKPSSLKSIFGLLNGKGGEGLSLSPEILSSELQYPKNHKAPSSNDYRKLAESFREKLSGVSLAPEYVNSLISLSESCFSFIPSFSSNGKTEDISLFDNIKLSAAISSCVSEFLIEHGCSDFKAALFDGKDRFLDEKAFIMFSCDFSGIQSFIYSVTSDKALKSLRSRSFWLEMFMEHLIDELIELAGVSRANLIYSGGGHCYVLLPATHRARNAAASVEEVFKKWLIEKFGDSLFIAFSLRECRALDLMNIPEEKEPYKMIYREISAELSKKKMKRFSAEDFSHLNVLPKERECRSCGKDFEALSENDGRCEQCSLFIDMSSMIQENKVLFAVLSEKPENKIISELPSCTHGKAYLSFVPINDYSELLKSEKLIRAYRKNNPDTGFAYAANIYMGDYSSSNNLTELASSGKMGVFRADVDSLGLAFISGFSNSDAKSIKDRNRHVTLARTASFSRELSRFFKYYLNGILEKHDDPDIRKALNAFGENRVSIVYSGGDDVFIIGEWRYVLYSALAIEECFRNFSIGKLTISGGISFCGSKYPVKAAAEETAELEDASKQFEDAAGKKNAITLFSAGDGKENHTYRWDIFRENVIGEKLASLKNFFSICNEKGNSLLYKLLDFLRNADRKINLARLAYLLARLETECADKAAYGVFSKKVYDWAKSPEDRRQLITAIYIYVYLKRQE